QARGQQHRIPKLPPHEQGEPKHDRQEQKEEDRRAEDHVQRLRDWERRYLGNPGQPVNMWPARRPAERRDGGRTLRPARMKKPPDGMVRGLRVSRETQGVEDQSSLSSSSSPTGVATGRPQTLWGIASTRSTGSSA